MRLGAIRTFYNLCICISDNGMPLIKVYWNGGGSEIAQWYESTCIKVIRSLI